MRRRPAGRVGASYDEADAAQALEPEAEAAMDALESDLADA
jgi:hypothetical protein